MPDVHNEKSCCQKDDEPGCNQTHLVEPVFFLERPAFALFGKIFIYVLSLVVMRRFMLQNVDTVS